MKNEKNVNITQDELFNRNQHSKYMFGRKNRVNIQLKDVHTGEIIQEETSNLIVYRGRNWLLQRAFDQDMSNRPNWNDGFISWVALGTGGSLAGQPLTPTAPALANYELDTYGTINTGLNYVTIGGRDYHKFDAGYPQFISDPEIENMDLDQSDTAVDPIDGQTYSCDKFLIGCVKITLGAEEANGGTDPEDYQDINEAGLFISPSTSLSYGFTPEDMQLFARVCFSTIRKTQNRELVFNWYLYF